MDSPRVCEDTNQFLAAFRASQNNSLKKYYSSPKPSQVAREDAVNSPPSRAEENVSAGLKVAPNQRSLSVHTISSALATSATATTPYVADNQSSENKMSPDRRQFSPPVEEAESRGSGGKGSTSNGKVQQDEGGGSDKDVVGNDSPGPCVAEKAEIDHDQHGSEKHGPFTPTRSTLSVDAAAHGFPQVKRTLFPPQLAERQQREPNAASPMSACSMAANNSDISDEVVLHHEQNLDKSARSSIRAYSQSKAVTNLNPVESGQQVSMDGPSSGKDRTATDASRQHQDRPPKLTLPTNKPQSGVQPRGYRKYGTPDSANPGVSRFPPVLNRGADRALEGTKKKDKKAEVQERLRQRREEEMVKFGKRQRGIIEEDDDDNAAATPSSTAPLSLARQGAGTDPSSPVAQGFARLIATEGKAMPIAPLSDHNSEEDAERPALIRDAADHQLSLNKYYNAVTQGGEEGDWKVDSLLVDWQFRPWQSHGDEQFVRDFRAWLENTMSMAYPLDTSSMSFADGTAHNDGLNGLLEEDFECEDSFLDRKVPANKHAHETAAGYAYNWIVNQQKSLRESTKRIPSTMIKVKQAESAPQPHPYAPRVKMYLRPVEPKDIPQLVKLCNWYVKNTKLVTDLDEVTEKDMEEYAAEAESQRFPFLVAAEQKPGVWYAMNSEDEGIYGYIGALDFTGHRTINRYTAELQLFVRPAMYRLGIGRCLVDKLLETLDPQYRAKGGYYFDCSNDKRKLYCSGGPRPTSRLVFVVHHLPDDGKEYPWLKKWLENDFGFEEQGVLKGTGVKDKTILNAAYLVYNTSINPVAGKTRK